MAYVEPQVRLLRFADFEVDLRTGELRKAGVKLKFSGQPFQVLAILLERPGDVVTREELQKRLWPDTFVDVERNLNTAVNKIRKVLSKREFSVGYRMPAHSFISVWLLEEPSPKISTDKRGWDLEGFSITQIPSALASGGDKTKAFAAPVRASSGYPLPTSQATPGATDLIRMAGPYSACPRLYADKVVRRPSSTGPPTVKW